MFIFCILQTCPLHCQARGADGRLVIITRCNLDSDGRRGRVKQAVTDHIVRRSTEQLNGWVRSCDKLRTTISIDCQRTHHHTANGNILRHTHGTGITIETLDHQGAGRQIRIRVIIENIKDYCVLLIDIHQIGDAHRWIVIHSNKINRHSRRRR